MFRMLKMLVSVPVVMVCAAAGTVGLIKAIEKNTPGKNKPNSTTEAGKG